jgi:hypothetical protein
MSNGDQTLDRREAILERLFTLGQGLNGIQTVLRNPNPPPRGVVQGLLLVPRPALFLFDGDTRLEQDTLRFKNQKMPATIWRMDPELAILIEQRDNFENTALGADVSPIGQEISSWVTAVNNQVINDPVILDLVSANGTHFRRAVTTSLKSTRDVGNYGAWAVMLYDFLYPVFPPR